VCDRIQNIALNVLTEQGMKHLNKKTMKTISQSDCKNTTYHCTYITGLIYLHSTWI